MNVRLLWAVALAVMVACLAAASGSGYPQVLGCIVSPGPSVLANGQLVKNPALSFAGGRGSAPVAGQWVSIGPSEILGPTVEGDVLGEHLVGQYQAVGRLTTMAVDPRNPDVIYVGSPGANGNEGSGVWKTTDGGTSWTPIADDLPSTGDSPGVAVDAIALDPINPDRVYVVIYQHGLYRSDDAGLNWTHAYDGDLHVRTNISEDGDRTGLLIDPLHPSVLYLTSDLGVLRSEDGGQTWPVSLGAGNAMSLVMDPLDPNILYAAIANSFGPSGVVGLIYKTEDGGAHWQPLLQSSGLPAGIMPKRNILLAISHPTPTTPATVYALFPRGPIYERGLFGGIGYDLFRSTDGNSWSKTFSCDPDLVNSDNSYNDCNFAVMSANPVNPYIVYIGGVTLWVSSDWGVDFQRVPSPDDDFDSFNKQPFAPHVDYWELATDPLSPWILYATSDGGIYKSECYGAEGSWTFIGKGITNVEMHDLALAKTAPGLATAGTADNGSIATGVDLVWNQFTGSDGGAVAIDPTDATRFYESGNEGDVSQYSTIEGQWHPFLKGIAKEISSGCHAYDQTFQLLIYPARSQPVLDACSSLWRTTVTTPPGDWQAIFTPPDQETTGERVVRVAIDPSADLYYAGTDRGRVFAALHGNNENWGDKPIFEHPNAFKISDIEVDTAHPTTIYSSFAPPTGLSTNCSINADRRIYELQRDALVSPTPALTSKKNITGDLPAGRCVNALAINPNIPRTVYAATDRGVYRGRSNATGGPWAWEPYNNGMPPANLRDLEVDADAGQLYAATSGRGAFKVTLETTLPVSIDIKPDSSENIINIKSKGTIPVAILSSVTFDAPNEVNRNSLRFGRTGSEASLARCNADAQDVNTDGLPDLVCQFYTTLTGFQVGDTQGLLNGLTTEGVPIAGSDAVKTLNQ